jgi:hypothetical protein
MSDAAEPKVEPGGLDLTDPARVSARELAEFRAHYTKTKEGQNRSYEFWFEHRPDVVKRHKARTVQWHSGPPSCLSSLSAMHQYIIQAFSDGIEYELVLSRNRGALKSDVLDLISVAFIHAGHPGMYMVADTVGEQLREYEEVPGRRFPEGWGFDPHAFTSGMDFTQLEASPDDIAALLAWYRQTLGSVPGHVSFLASYRPDLLKAYRNRYEHAIAESLPKEMMAYTQIQFNTYRGFASALRENVLLAKSFVMSRSQVLDAMLSAVLYAGANALDVAQDAAGDLLPLFEDRPS